MLTHQISLAFCDAIAPASSQLISFMRIVLSRELLQVSVIITSLQVWSARTSASACSRPRSSWANDDAMSLSTSMINHEQFGVVILTGDGHVVLNDDALDVIRERMINDDCSMIDELAFISQEQRSDLLEECLAILETAFNAGMSKDAAIEHLLRNANNERAARLFVLRRVRAKNVSFTSSHACPHSCTLF